MLDFRMDTFLMVCKTMSYTKAAEALCMTQPAVSQQIRYLEENYGTKLFEYKGRVLTKTVAGEKLEQYSLSMKQNENNIRRAIRSSEKPYCLRVGATKTIGDYVVGERITKYLQQKNRTLELEVDNTRHLLGKLEQGELDLALIEGMFDKSRYSYKLLAQEPFVGICATEHRFAGKTVTLEEAFTETVVVREQGSGTRDIFEHLLQEKGFTLKNFSKAITISNFSVIKHLVCKNLGISFLYQTVLTRNNNGLAVFSIEGCTKEYEFNFVWLKDQVFSDEIKTFMK